MAAGKKSFVLYSDLLVSIGHLTNEEKGILFNHLLEYVNDKSPVLEDRLLITAWKPIEMQLKRDLKKFEEIKVKRSEAGKKSAEIKSQQNSTNSTDNVNVNDNDNDTVINNKPQAPKGDDFNIHCERFVKYVSEQTGRKFKTLNDKNKRKLQSTIKQYSWEQIRDAVYYATQNKFHKDNNYQYLTPEFFTRPETIDKYAFPSEKQKEYTGENAHLVNHVDKYLNAVKS